MLKENVLLGLFRLRFHSFPLSLRPKVIMCGPTSNCHDFAFFLLCLFVHLFLFLSLSSSISSDIPSCLLGVLSSPPFLSPSSSPQCGAHGQDIGLAKWWLAVQAEGLETHAHTRTHAHTHTHWQTWTHANTHATPNTHTHAHARARARAHTHTHTHINMYSDCCPLTQSHFWPVLRQRWLRWRLELPGPQTELSDEALSWRHPRGRSHHRGQQLRHLRP